MHSFNRLVQNFNHNIINLVLFTNNLIYAIYDENLSYIDLFNFKPYNSGCNCMIKDQFNYSNCK